ncbi:unnamed protein product [Trichobilharzia regenti]|nr:unnamed protein product [Trichobilharzia regenti]
MSTLTSSSFSVDSTPELLTPPIMTKLHNNNNNSNNSVTWLLRKMTKFLRFGRNYSVAYCLLIVGCLLFSSEFFTVHQISTGNPESNNNKLPVNKDSMLMPIDRHNNSSVIVYSKVVKDTKNVAVPPPFSQPPNSAPQKKLVSGIAKNLSALPTLTETVQKRNNVKKDKESNNNINNSHNET